MFVSRRFGSKTNALDGGNDPRTQTTSRKCLHGYPARRSTIKSTAPWRPYPSLCTRTNTLPWRPPVTWCLITQWPADFPWLPAIASPRNNFHRRSISASRLTTCIEHRTWRTVQCARIRRHHRSSGAFDFCDSVITRGTKCASRSMKPKSKPENEEGREREDGLV